MKRSPGGRDLRIAALGLGLLLLPACLDKQDPSLKILTEVEDETPGTSSIQSSATHKNVEHVTAPAGKQADGTIAGPTSTEGGAAPVGSPEAHEHVERPGGFDDKSGKAGESELLKGEAPANGDAPPVGAPEPVEHVVREAGYGSKQPDKPTPEKVPGPAGNAGAPVPVPGEPQNAQPIDVPPLEKENAGKKMVTISGQLTVEGKAEGAIDIDCFVPDKSTPAGRKLVNKVKVPAPGPWSMKVPVNYGKLILSGFMDLNGNGPDRSDPQGVYDGNPLEVKDKNLSSVNLVLRPSSASTAARPTAPAPSSSTPKPATGSSR